MNKLFYVLFAIPFFISCTDKKPLDQKNINSAKKDTTLAGVVAVETQKMSDLDIYNVNSIFGEKDTIAHISLSDNYQLSEHKDSLAIPDVKKLEEKDAQYLVLNSTYRNRMLSKMKISEKDSVYVYDYATNIVNAFSVESLKAVAVINVYGADWPYSQHDYMIGFEVDPKLLKGSDSYYLNTLVGIGSKNPFAMKQLKAIKWKETTIAKVPAAAVNLRDNDLIKTASKKMAYSYKSNGFEYFLQDYIKEERVFLRRLIVKEEKTNKIVCDKHYRESEGNSLAELNSNNEDREVIQWTGKLFKNKPEVVFGFEYVSFGCPGISFLDKNEPDVFLNCDNRH
ncbi:oxidoreductase [Flavobacterium sp. F-65]|uniref:Oxidoreductase n=1 Tax=Flavobacterium pisciphilum TaxID=2893755 RepID=A0ABS8MU66_9FLAO|nr:oxidoreductase [Flavobacterium sp. F-65]MCC9072307.1 oxidoreductase [Flavobacterium sp. F-65]